jgi:hypothetical protein
VIGPPVACCGVGTWAQPSSAPAEGRKTLPYSGFVGANGLAPIRTPTAAKEIDQHEDHYSPGLAPANSSFMVPHQGMGYLSGIGSGGSQITGPLTGLHKHWMSVRQQHIYMSVVFFAVGFSAITALAIASIGWLPLDIAAYILIWPSLVTWLVLGILYPKYGKLALKGFAIGMLACLFYDSMRFVTIALGLWGDFIPKIGMMLLHTDKPSWVIGYIWRYIGDGGFMCVTFIMGYHLLKPKLDVRIAALSFGIAIWLCLMGTILLAPHGTETLFPLTPITFSLSLLGHIIYGLSIGFLYRIFIDKRVPSVFPVIPNIKRYATSVYKRWTIWVRAMPETVN